MRARSRVLRLGVATSVAGAVVMAGPWPPAVFAAGPSAQPSPAASTQCERPSPDVVHAVPWAQQQLGPDRVWKFTRGAGVTVAVLDSGVSARAPALAGAVLPGSDVTSRGRADDDCSGHGTFVAGVIAARQVPGVGFAGMAPDATILPIRVVTPDDRLAQTTAATLATGIRAAVDGGAAVVDISVETSEDSPVLRAAVKYAESKNVVLVAAIDDKPASSQGRYPAAYSTVLAVNGIAQSGPNGESLTADAGATSGPVRIDLAAPGAQVVSIGRVGNGHYVGDGAAYAAPFVAATAALVHAYLPDLTAAQIRKRLETTADRTGGSVPDPLYGYGVVDPFPAVTAILPGDDGATARPRAAVPAQPVARHADHGPAVAAIAVLGGVVGLLALCAAIGATVRGGRARHWAPADRPDGEAEA